MKSLSTENIIFNRKGWLLWSCLFYFFIITQAAGQVAIRDKARVQGMGTLRGKLLKYDVNGRMLFLRKTGDTISVDVRRVVHTKITPIVTMYTRGSVWHSLEAGLDWGRPNASSTSVPLGYLQTNHAYVINRFVQPGLGAGLQFQGDFRIMPVFFSLTGDLLNSRVTPFYFTNLGYGFGWASKNRWREYTEVRGGLGWHVGGGLKIAGRRTATYLKAGYKIQDMYYETNSWGWWGQPGFEKVHRTMRRVYFGLALAF